MKDFKDHLWDKLCLQLWAQLQSQLDVYSRCQLREHLENPLWDSIKDEFMTHLWAQITSEERTLGGES